MLKTKKRQIHQTRTPAHYKSITLHAKVYHFPMVEGFEEIGKKMAFVKAESLFSALLKGYNLSPITNEKLARKAERFLEYLLRAFEKKCPQHVAIYRHLLEMLIEEFDAEHTIACAKNLPAHRLLKVLLEEECLDQKALVPSCFKSASQVSEFLSQQKGRQNLTAEQAIKLGKRFRLNPLLFLNTRSLAEGS